MFPQLPLTVFEDPGKQVTVVRIEVDTDTGGELVVQWKRQKLCQTFLSKVEM